MQSFDSAVYIKWNVLIYSDTKNELRLCNLKTDYPAKKTSLIILNTFWSNQILKIKDTTGIAIDLLLLL